MRRIRSCHARAYKCVSVPGPYESRVSAWLTGAKVGWSCRALELRQIRFEFTTISLHEVRIRRYCGVPIRAGNPFSGAVAMIERCGHWGADHRTSRNQEQQLELYNCPQQGASNTRLGRDPPGSSRSRPSGWVARTSSECVNPSDTKVRPRSPASALPNVETTVAAGANQAVGVNAAVGSNAHHWCASGCLRASGYRFDSRLPARARSPLSTPRRATCEHPVAARCRILGRGDSRERDLIEGRGQHRPKRIRFQPAFPRFMLGDSLILL